MSSSGLIDPTPEAIERFVAEAPDQPVAMLNLLRFTTGGGAARYAEYGRRVLAHLKRVGATIVYGGTGSIPLAAPDAQEWDAVYLVHYPTRRAFAEMVLDASYQAELMPLRSSGLAANVLLPTNPLFFQAP
jgi:hypothetical protein